MVDSKPKDSFNDSALGVEFLNRIAAFETIRAYHGKFFHLDAHLDRLGDSCRGLGHELPMDKAAWIAWIRTTLQESGFLDAIMRISVHWRAAGEGVIISMTRPFVTHPPEWYQQGVTLSTTSQRRPSFRAQDSGIKCSQYVSGVLATIDQGAETSHELIFLGPAESVAEGTVSNLFIVKSKRILTPSAASGILSGVTRNFVIFLCQSMGYEVSETMLTRHDIYTADECFITNTSSEVLGVVRVDGRRIGEGVPGPITKNLHQNFRMSIEESLL